MYPNGPTRRKVFRDLALTEMAHELRSNAEGVCEKSIVESSGIPS
jgi:hypothetical protein